MMETKTTNTSTIATNVVNDEVIDTLQLAINEMTECNDHLGSLILFVKTFIPNFAPHDLVIDKFHDLYIQLLALRAEQLQAGGLDHEMYELAKAYRMNAKDLVDEFFVSEVATKLKSLI